jgi:dihydropyrimidinase
MNQLLIKGGKCVSGGITFNADILVDEGKIVAIGQNLIVSAEQVIDAHDKLILPGGVDVHVHLPWPTGSFVSSDTINTGTRAAAFGGVTSVIDFAIPQEDESLSAALQTKIDEARSNAWVDYSFHLNIRGETANKISEIPDLVAAGLPSFKIFMAYEGFRLEDRQLLEVLAAVTKANGIVSVHAENGSLADHFTQGLLESGRKAVSDYAFARPSICEEEAIQRLLKYQQLTDTRLHIHHVSTAGGAKQIGRARRAGRSVSAETCPHYLVFTDQDYSRNPASAAALICAPSIKSAVDQTALWQALASGVLSVVATDHCPYTRAQKEQHLDDFSQIPGGMAGVETRLPLLFSEGVLKGRLSLERFSQVWAEEPARIFGLFPRKGLIAVGCDADLVIFNPAKKWALRAADLHMNTDCLSYEGMEVTGKAETTILRGNIIIQNGKQILSSPNGQLIPRSFAK